MSYCFLVSNVSVKLLDFAVEPWCQWLQSFHSFLKAKQQIFCQMIPGPNRLQIDFSFKLVPFKACGNCEQRFYTFTSFSLILTFNSPTCLKVTLWKMWIAQWTFWSKRSWVTSCDYSSPSLWSLLKVECWWTAALIMYIWYPTKTNTHVGNLIALLVSGATPLNTLKW